MTGDTTSTAASGWALLLNASTRPAEFTLLTITVSGAVITLVGQADGRPFAGMTGGLTSAGAGGATVTQTTTVAGSSPSDVGLAANWLRAGVAAIPVNGDDVIVQNSSVPLLYNLNALSAVLLNTWTRWQTFTGTIGLPENNPAGYYEYLPTYLKLAGNVSPLPVLLGQGTQGSGPSRERYDFQAFEYSCQALQAGGALDAFAIRILGSNVANVLEVGNTSVGVAMLPAETAALADTTRVNPGGTLSLGPGTSVAAAATVVCQGGSLTLFAAFAGTVQVYQGGNFTMQAPSGTQTTVLVEGGSQVTWSSGASITTLTLRSASVFNKPDARPITITNSAQDGDTTQVNDATNSITWTNPVTLQNAVTGGPFITGPGRTVQIS